MPTIKELRNQIKELESELEKQLPEEPEPDWMAFLHKRLPGFRRTGERSFRCDGARGDCYGSQYFTDICVARDEKGIAIVKAFLEMLEAAKRGEIDGWSE